MPNTLVGNIMGPQGPQGVSGADAYSQIAAPGFTTPALGGSVNIPAVNASSFGVGQIIYTEGGGYYAITAINTGTNTITGDAQNYPGDPPPGTVVAAGGTIAGTGPQGEQGLQGFPGQAATIQVGTTTTLEPGSPSTVANSGSTSAAVFDFGIARGTAWFTGGGAPAQPYPGSMNGDLYLDTTTGDYYRLINP